MQREVQMYPMEFQDHNSIQEKTPEAPWSRDDLGITQKFEDIRLNSDPNHDQQPFKTPKPEPQNLQKQSKKIPDPPPKPVIQKAMIPKPPQKNKFSMFKKKVKS